MASINGTVSSWHKLSQARQLFVGRSRYLKPLATEPQVLYSAGVACLCLLSSFCNQDMSVTAALYAEPSSRSLALSERGIGFIQMPAVSHRLSAYLQSPPGSATAKSITNKSLTCPLRLKRQSAACSHGGGHGQECDRVARIGCLLSGTFPGRGSRGDRPEDSTAVHNCKAGQWLCRGRDSPSPWPLSVGGRAAVNASLPQPAIEGLLRH